MSQPKIEPLEFKITNWMDDVTRKVICPICGYDYVHHEATATVLLGQDAYKASQHVRGSVICLPMHCEGGHRWNTLIGFHKGSTVVWCERLPDLPEDEPWLGTKER